MVGWRVWSVVESGGELRLASPVYHEVWEPGARFTARCRRPLAALPWGRLPLHEAPAYDCCCGIHALATPERAAAYLRSEGDKGAPAVQRVLGAVSLWGRVVEATNGWRASVAYPHRIIVPTGRLQRVVAAALWPYRPSPGAVAEALEAYGVPVELSESRSIAADRPLAVR